MFYKKFNSTVGNQLRKSVRSGPEVEESPLLSLLEPCIVVAVSFKDYPLVLGENSLEKSPCRCLEVICLLELKGLNGREVLKGYDFRSLVAYEGK